MRQPRKRHYHLTVTDKAALIGLKAAGKTYRDIAKILEVDERTVSRNFKRISTENTYERKKGSGNQRRTNDREDQMIIREVRRNRFTTSKEIKQNLPHMNISRQTIRRRINEVSDFRCHFQSRKPMVSETNRRRRIAWCTEHLNWTVEQWAKVLWSDESPYVYRFNQKRRVWRTAAEKYSAVTTRATVKHDKKINVWGCFARHGVGHLYLVDGILLKEQYIQIVEDHFYPSAMDLFPELDCIFQEDNDPKHTARIVKQWWADQQLHRMDWPSQSPDLNPIENLWTMLDRAAMDRQPRNDQELFTVLQEAWNALSPDLLVSLVDSMPRRCQAVLDARGYATKY